MPSANIRQVYAMLEGVKILATYDAEKDLYVIDGVAPAYSSYPQPDHKFHVTLYAEDLAGNQVTMGADDPTYGEQLKIRVYDRTKPVATITYPTQDSMFGSSEQTITFEITDKGGSGLDTATGILRINDQQIEDVEWTVGDDGNIKGSYTAVGLHDGSNTVELSMADFDGNASETDTVSFIISTAAPTLAVSEPIEGLITAGDTVTIKGTAGPGSQYVTVKSVAINGDAVEISSEGGEWSFEAHLIEGINEFKIIATDSVDNTTVITRRVIMDTTAPVISDVVTETLNVDASGKIRITFRVTDPAAPLNGYLA